MNTLENIVNPMEVQLETTPDFSLDVELSDEELEILLDAQIVSPEGQALNDSNWNLRDTIAREIAPKLEAIREARAQLFKRFEDRYCSEAFEALILPSHIAAASKD